MNRSYSLGHVAHIAALALFVSTGADAAQFQFGKLIRAGFTSGSAGNWEMSLGATPGATAATSSLNTYWNNNQDRLVQVEYLKASNTVNVRVYVDGTSTSAFTQVSYNPAGGAAVAANAVWTLPASSFFVTAATGPTQNTSIQVSNLAIAGVSGAINVIQPMQQTTLQASYTVGGSATTSQESQNIVFQADSTGSWLLSGTIRLNGIQGGGRATGNQLILSLAASASDVP
jgi:hypothetical protein